MKDLELHDEPECFCAECEKAREVSPPKLQDVIDLLSKTYTCGDSPMGWGLEDGYSLEDRVRSAIRMLKQIKG